MLGYTCTQKNKDLTVVVAALVVVVVAEQNSKTNAKCHTDPNDTQLMPSAAYQPVPLV